MPSSGVVTRQELRSSPRRRPRSVSPGSGTRLPELLFDLGTHVLVGPVVAFEGPVLFLVAEVARGVEGVDRILGEVAEADGFDLHLERSLSSEDALDPPEARAAQEPRQPEVETMQGVLCH